MLYYNRLDIRLSHYAVNKALSGVKMLPDLFVSFCGIEQVELPSFTIELQSSVAIPRRALKSLKKRDFGVGFIVIRFFR